MLMHSRGSGGNPEPVDLNTMVKEYVNLSFHGMRAGKQPITVDIQYDLDPKAGNVSLIAEDFSRVILNLCNNAFDAMRSWEMEQAAGTKDSSEKEGFKTGSAAGGGGYPAGTEAKGRYLPKLTVRTRKENGCAVIDIEDNGPGIPDDLKDKILVPFFTTKKGTEGTGLGLSITHDIIKAHGGRLDLKSKTGEGTTFSITIPVEHPHNRNES